MTNKVDFIDWVAVFMQSHEALRDGVRNYSNLRDDSEVIVDVLRVMTPVDGYGVVIAPHEVCVPYCRAAFGKLSGFTPSMNEDRGWKVYVESSKNSKIRKFLQHFESQIILS